MKQQWFKGDIIQHTKTKHTGIVTKCNEFLLYVYINKFGEKALMGQDANDWEIHKKGTDHGIGDLNEEFHN